MMLDFDILAAVAAMVCFALSLIWLLRPQILLSLWRVDYSDEVGLVSRRAAALFLGLGVMFSLARHAEPGPGRAALSEGFTVGCLALAILGLYELGRKRAGIGILSAVATELLLAVAFILYG
jgi:hypothetical protein